MLTYSMSFPLSNLISKDTFGKSDPFVQVFAKGDKGELQEIGKTETIE